MRAGGDPEADRGDNQDRGQYAQASLHTRRGLSRFKSNNNAVIPVKFALSQGTGAFVFESIGSDTATTNDYSLLQWQAKASNGTFTLNQLTTLIANYQFTLGDCHAGSLRWTVTLNDNGVNRNLDIHYQPGHDSLSDQFCAVGTSGHNMVDLASPSVVLAAGTPAPPGKAVAYRPFSKTMVSNARNHKP